MKLPNYHTPEGTTCPECGEECAIIALDNSFDYAGTHCTFGLAGVHYPAGFGSPVSSCCEADMDGEQEEEMSYSDYQLIMKMEDEAW